jgi:hypothetical protein
MERARELLAKSTVVEKRWHILSPGERDELSGYVARAEVSATDKTALDVTRSSLGARSKACLATACGTLANPEVKETLRASHEALMALPGIQRVATSTLPAKNQQETAFSYGLESYGRLTQTCFVKRRCSDLNRRQVGLFYRAIIRSHHAAMLQFGKPARFHSAEICRNPC